MSAAPDADPMAAIPDTLSASKRERQKALCAVLDGCMSTSIRMEFMTEREASDHARKLRALGISCGRDRDSVFVPRDEFESAGVL